MERHATADRSTRMDAEALTSVERLRVHVRERVRQGLHVGGLWSSPELLHHAHPVELPAKLDDLARCNAVEDCPGNRDLAAGGSDPLEVAAMCSGTSPSFRDDVALPDEFLDL